MDFLAATSICMIIGAATGNFSNSKIVSEQMSILGLVSLVSAFPLSAQDAVMTIEQYEPHPDVLSLLRFQNIDVYKMRFSGEALNGKSYSIRIRKYDHGKRTLDETLIDTSELGELGKVKSGELKFRFLSQAKDGKAKFELQTDRFSGAKTYLASESKFSYVMKDFLGAKENLKFDANKELNMLALLQPLERSDGSASYCEVAQSGVDPEKLFESHKLPTYFLISVLFR